MKNLAILLVATLLISCSPNINYLGETYPETTHVDTYYDEGDIKKEFKVIGQLTGDNINSAGLGLDKIKDEMIIEAKLRGADGIWFLFSDSFDNDHVVKAKLLKYQE